MSRRVTGGVGLLLAASFLLPARAGAADGAGSKDITREEVAEIVRQMRSGSTMQERLEAIGKLGSLSNMALLREFRVVDEFTKLLKSTRSGARERKAAVEALRTLWLRDPAYESTISQAMLAVLQDPAELTILRMEAAETFRLTLKAESPASTPGIQAILRVASEGKEPVLVAKALEAIGDIAPAEGIEALRKGMTDKDPVIRGAAIKALPRFLQRQAAGGNVAAMIGVLQKLAADKDLAAEVRVEVIEALAWLARASAKPQEIAEALRAVLEKEEDPVVAASAARAMRLTPDRRAVETLAATYGRFKGGDKNEGVRLACCVSLGEMFDPFARTGDFRTAETAAGLLVKALKDPEEGNAVRRAAVFALGNMNQAVYDRREVVRALVDVLLNDKTADGALQAEIQHSLEFLTPTIQETPEAWKAWLDREGQDTLRSR